MRNSVSRISALQPAQGGVSIDRKTDRSALDPHKAWNTGQPGGLATIHANSAAEGLTRLEDLIGEATARIPYRAIVQAIGLILFIERTALGRRLHVPERLRGREGDQYVFATTTGAS